MSRGTGTKKLLNEATVSKALKGDRATLDELARKGGNRGSSKSDTGEPQAADAAKQQAEADAMKKVLETPVPNEKELADKLGVPVETIRRMHAQVDKLYPNSPVAMNAKAIKDAEAKAAKGGGKEGEEKEAQPWWKKSGPGFWNILRERGRGSTNEMPTFAGGGEQGGGPSLEDLIKKKVVITGKPSATPPTVPAPTTPSTGA